MEEDVIGANMKYNIGDYVKIVKQTVRHMDGFCIGKVCRITERFTFCGNKYMAIDKEGTIYCCNEEEIEKIDNEEELELVEDSFTKEQEVERETIIELLINELYNGVLKTFNDNIGYDREYLSNVNILYLLEKYDSKRFKEYTKMILQDAEKKEEEE